MAGEMNWFEKGLAGIVILGAGILPGCGNSACLNDRKPINPKPASQSKREDIKQNTEPEYVSRIENAAQIYSDRFEKNKWKAEDVINIYNKIDINKLSEEGRESYENFRAEDYIETAEIYPWISENPENWTEEDKMILVSYQCLEGMFFNPDKIK